MGVLPHPSAYANVNSIFLAINLEPLAFKNREALNGKMSKE